MALFREAGPTRGGILDFGGTVRKQKLAFSLVEVVFALGVAAFALVILIGLLPVGLQANRESRQEGVAVNIVDALIADLKTSPKSAASVLYQLPAVYDPTHATAGLQAASTLTNAFSDGLQLLASVTDPNARYQVVVTRQSIYTNSLNPVLYTFVVYPLPRPAASTSQGILETTMAIPSN